MARNARSKGTDPDQSDPFDAANVVGALVAEGIQGLQAMAAAKDPQDAAVIALQLIVRLESRFDELTPDTVAFRKSAANHLLALERLLYALRLLMEADDFDVIAELKLSARRIVNSYKRAKALDPEVLARLAHAVEREYNRFMKRLEGSNDPKVTLGLQVLRGLEFTELSRLVDQESRLHTTPRFLEAPGWIEVANEPAPKRRVRASGTRRKGVQ